MEVQESIGLIGPEVSMRRTFAIISHPDAGKTTLTEKLLLYAGMIKTAGMVRGRKNAKAVSSDWMEMERERGISITASAMQFHYKDVVINVLDTPGHQDFSEDTYRTLTAADSAVMVLDAGKGVETQTRKLFTVCRMRNTPIFTFINKLDLPGRDPFDLLSEVESVLGIKSSPMNWPVGQGKEFVGIIDLRTQELVLFDSSQRAGTTRVEQKRCLLSEAGHLIPKDLFEKVTFELELLREAGNQFDMEAFRAGVLTPVFFGSGLTNFGVEPFFDSFAELAPPPSPRPANKKTGEEITIDPVRDPFSGYVFKMQANMNPKHRDSMAYIRICSGKFERDLVVKHPRLDKEIRLSRSHSMFGGERNTIDEAFAGDIVGVVNPGVFAVGDSVSVSGDVVFKPMPRFPPEVVAALRPIDVLKRKNFEKGMKQFSEEGSVLILTPRTGYHSGPLVAAVGKLQFEVLQYRLEHEYGVRTELDNLAYRYGAWLVGNVETFKPPSGSLLADDTNGKTIFLYKQEWERGFALEKNPDHQLLEFVQ